MTINIDDFVSRKTEEAFPNFLITNPNQTLPVVVRNLEEGDTQLIVEVNGVRKCVKRVSRSALNVNKLLRTVGSFEYVLGQGSSVTITDIEKYLNCVR